MLLEPAYDRTVNLEEKTIIDAKRVDWARECCSSNLRWIGFEDRLSRRCLMLRDGEGRVRFWCIPAELNEWTETAIEQMLVADHRNAGNLPMYFTGDPGIPTLVVEVDVCEIPWQREWTVQMATMQAAEFPSYFRENIWPDFSDDQRGRIGTRLQEVFVAFDVYRRAIADSDNE